MIADLKPYAVIKDSGVVWLGEVPKGWDVLRGRQLFEIKKRISGELGHPVISVTQEGLRVKDVESGEGQLSQDYSKYQTVEVGEFAMNSMDLLTGGVGISTIFGVTSPDYRVFAIRDESRCCDRYMLHVLRMLYRNRGFYAWGQGSAQLGRWRLPRKRFNDFPFPVPPFTEQVAIARFLDWANGRLERAIRAKRKVIALLTEQKQAIIHRAVTRGIDPSVPLKPSSIPWLGDIPQHWEVRKLKNIKSRAKNAFVDGPFGSSLKSIHYVPNGYAYVVESGFITSGEFRWKEFKTITKEHFSTIQRSSCSEGDIVIAKIGANFGMAGILPALMRPAVVSGNSLKLTVDNAITSNCFVHVALLTARVGGALDWIVNATAQPALSLGTLNNLSLPVPPREEQDKILVHISGATKELVSAIARLEREIELLHEYRTRLVADVVTGKLDVREAASRLPEESATDTVEEATDLIDETETADEEAAV